jgi:hypothetical protein
MILGLEACYTCVYYAQLKSSWHIPFRYFMGKSSFYIKKYQHLAWKLWYKSLWPLSPINNWLTLYCISSETLNDPGIRSMLYMCVLCTADYGSNVMFFYFQTHNFIGLNWCDFCANFMLYRVHHTWVGFELATLVVIGTDCTGSCKSNYHMIMTMTAPWYSEWKSTTSLVDTLAVIKEWPYKRGGLCWRGQFSCILLFQCVWNLS